MAVLREPEGRGGSACVHDDLAQGDELDASGPRNNFPLLDADASVPGRRSGPAARTARRLQEHPLPPV